MSFDNLWEMYGEKSKPQKAAGSPERTQQAVKEAAPVHEKHDPAPFGYEEDPDTWEEDPGPMPGVFGANAGNADEGAREDDPGPMPGVFGANAGNAGNADEGSWEENPGPMPGVFGANGGGRSPGTPERRSFNRGSMRYWPWVDIICIAITVIMVICVAANFEEVTTALFRAMLPLLSNLVVLLLVVGVIAFAIWRIARRPRRPRRRW